MKQDHIPFFNPANAASVTTEQFKEFGELSNEQVAELAAEYPNKKHQTSYLVLRDKTKKDNEQVYPASSWENLNNLYKMNQTQYEAVGFKANFKKEQAGTVKTAPAQDLTNQQAKDELKNAGKVENTGNDSEDQGDDFKEVDVPKTAAPKKVAQKTATKSAAKKAAPKKSGK